MTTELQRLEEALGRLGLPLEAHDRRIAPDARWEQQQEHKQLHEDMRQLQAKIDEQMVRIEEARNRRSGRPFRGSPSRLVDVKLTEPARATYPTHHAESTTDAATAQAQLDAALARLGMAAPKQEGEL